MIPNQKLSQLPAAAPTGIDVLPSLVLNHTGSTMLTLMLNCSNSTPRDLKSVLDGVLRGDAAGKARRAGQTYG
ncbi:hypothetical protein D3C71_1992160 [compost metagenome]